MIHAAAAKTLTHDDFSAATGDGNEQPTLTLTPAEPVEIPEIEFCHLHRYEFPTVNEIAVKDCPICSLQRQHGKYAAYKHRHALKTNVVAGMPIVTLADKEQKIMATLRDNHKTRQEAIANQSDRHIREEDEPKVWTALDWFEWFVKCALVGTVSGVGLVMIWRWAGKG